MLEPHEYERCRTRRAKELGVRTSMLDNAVKAERAALARHSKCIAIHTPSVVRRAHERSRILCRTSSFVLVVHNCDEPCRRPTRPCIPFVKLECNMALYSKLMLAERTAYAYLCFATMNLYVFF